MSTRASYLSTLRLSARVVVVTVRGDEHGDSRPAIGFDLVVVFCSGRIEACDSQEIGAFEKRGKQAGGLERIGHVQNRLRVQQTQQGLDLGDDMGGSSFVMELAQRLLTRHVGHDHGFDIADIRAQQRAKQ